MHDCDVMISIGARFDDRITGRLDAFSPGSTQDPCRHRSVVDQQERQGRYPHRRRLRPCARRHAARSGAQTDAHAGQGGARRLVEADRQAGARASRLAYKNSDEIIKPQYAIERLYELTKDRDTYITTEVGQHQMWAAQFYHFQEPNRWMTSGGLGTMGYGLPAAIGVQMAHPKSLVIDIAGEASVLMNMQEMSTAVQYRLPIKIFILNNQYMGMVRQWQELLHGGRYSRELHGGAAGLREAGRGLSRASASAARSRPTSTPRSAR